MQKYFEVHIGISEIIKLCQSQRILKENLKLEKIGGNILIQFSCMIKSTGPYF